MSVKELILKDHPIEIKIVPAANIEGALVFRITWMENKLTACIDRNQAHLLMLYLQEHLTPHTKKLKDAIADLWLCDCKLYHTKNYICEMLK